MPERHGARFSSPAPSSSSSPMATLLAQLPEVKALFAFSANSWLDAAAALLPQHVPERPLQQHCQLVATAPSLPLPLLLQLQFASGQWPLSPQWTSMLLMLVSSPVVSAASAGTAWRGLGP